MTIITAKTVSLLPQLPYALAPKRSTSLKLVDYILHLQAFWNSRIARYISFLQAVLLGCDGIIALGYRHAELAREMAAAETDAVHKAELERIAEVCTRIQAEPPRDFHEACQMVWFVMMAIQIEATADSVAVGRFDQFMYPFKGRTWPTAP